MLTQDERYLNLATINIGEAVTELGNIRQRGGVPGSDFANVKLALLRAISAVYGELWAPPPPPKPEDHGTDAAVTRDLVAERAVLEGGGTSLPTALVEIEWSAPGEGAERIRDPGTTATERHEAIMNVIGTEWVDPNAPALVELEWDPQP